MDFILDNQTFNDLSLLTRSNDEKSLIDFFSQTKTFGGRRKLEEIFTRPITDIDVLKGRRDSIRYLSQNETLFVFDKAKFNFIEFYFNIKESPEKYSYFSSLREYLRNVFFPNNNYYLVKRGVQYLTDQLIAIYRFSENVQSSNAPEFLKSFGETILKLISASDLKSVVKNELSRKLNIFNIYKYDYLFRFSLCDLLQKILGMIYELDVYMSVAEFAKENNLSYPLFILNIKGIIEIEGCYHPFIKNPIKNDVQIDTQRNILLLTGANMTGKSTILKAIGINTFLSHLGFPVFADYMELSIYNGILTTINLPDNISKGYSHFYSEVLRIKEICLSIKKLKNVVVIFDELFKATNSPDSTDAAFSIIRELSKLDGCPILISTHNFELAMKLSQNSSIQFKCFKIFSNCLKPQSYFSLSDGISNEHNGNSILQNENVINIIKEVVKEQEFSEEPNIKRIII